MYENNFAKTNATNRLPPWEEFAAYLGPSARTRTSSSSSSMNLARRTSISQIVRIPEKAYRAMPGAVSAHSIEYKGETIPILALEKERANRRGWVALLRQGSKNSAPTGKRAASAIAASITMPTGKAQETAPVRKRLDPDCSPTQAIGRK